MPFGVRSVGHYVVDGAYAEKPVVKHFIELFWGVEGTGEFVVDNQRQLLGPGQVCFYLPGDEHRIRAHDCDWIYRWLTIDGASSLDIFQQFAFSKRPVDVGVCPEDLFLKLEREILDHTPHGQRLASATAYSILALAHAGGCKVAAAPSIPERCISIIRKNYASPFFDVNQLAATLGIHRSRISRMFREQMHTTLKDYIVACRLQKGMSLLKESNISIASVAEKCGYGNADYFAKSIRKATGFSPSEFRRQGAC